MTQLDYSDMAESDYIESIAEQLRAYGFEERDEEDDSYSLVFSRQSQGRLPRSTTYEFVAITTLDEANVETVKRTVDNARQLCETLGPDSASRLESRRYFLLMVSPTVTEPMRIRTRREHGSEIDDDGFLLPILADLENGKLIYEDPSVVKRPTTHGRMATDAEKYFTR